MAEYSGPRIPFVMPPVDADALADWFEAEYPDEFCASLSFEPDFVEAFCAAGFITMAMCDEGEYLIPKLHVVRSVMVPGDFVLTRTARRESSRYSLALDTSFPEVLDACVATHGEDWLRPPLRQAWLELFASRRRRRCRFSSMELRRGTLLVAGEIGVFAGSCYTSLTGFRRESGAGTVQLAATAGYLRAVGVTLWDLGMPLDYKETIGAHDVSRAEFLSLFRYAREIPPCLPAPSLPAGPFPARGLIDGITSP